MALEFLQRFKSGNLHGRGGMGLLLKLQDAWQTHFKVLSGIAFKVKGMPNGDY